jgi:hypothetical protein
MKRDPAKSAPAVVDVQAAVVAATAQAVAASIVVAAAVDAARDRAGKPRVLFAFSNLGS